MPQTGQTTCYDVYGNVIFCSDTGQDGDVQAGVAWPSPRFTDNGNGTITDNLTGLIWLKDANCFGPRYWSDALSDANALANGSCGLSDGSSAGDWGLPNINEFESLHNAEESDVAGWLNTQGFTNVQPIKYWSGTSVADSSNAWQYRMANGHYSASPRSGTGTTSDLFVWPVARAAATTRSVQLWKTGQTTSYATGDDGDLQKGVAWPSPRFTDNGNGTATDNLTGLIWLNDANCLKTNYPAYDTDGGVKGIKWESALNFLAGINDGTYSKCGAGYTDWRLPNRKEFVSLIDYSQFDNALPSGHPFINMRDHYSWQGTTALSRDYVYEVHVANGSMGAGSKNSWQQVWPVRAGQSGSFIDIPTLSEWGMLLFVVLLLFSGILFIRGSGARGRGSEFSRQ